jgi:hypothetical protein
MANTNFTAKKGLKVGGFIVNEDTGSVTITGDLAVSGTVTSNTGITGETNWSNLINLPDPELTINVSSTEAQGFSIAGTGTGVFTNLGNASIDLQITTLSVESQNSFYTIRNNSTGIFTAVSPQDTMYIVPGSGIGVDVGVVGGNNTVTISNSGILSIGSGDANSQGYSVVTTNGAATLTLSQSSTTIRGIVQLSDTPNSTSTTTAPTSNALATVYTNSLLKSSTSLQTLSGSLKLRAGTATADTAPLYFQSGTNLTAPVNGAVEYNGTDLLFTQGGTRYKVLLDNLANLTSAATARTALGLGTAATTPSSDYATSTHTHTSFASNNTVRFDGGIDLNNTIINNVKLLDVQIYTNTVSANATTITLANGNFQQVPLSSASSTVTVSFSGTNALPGKYYIIFTQGSTARTVSLNTTGITWKWYKNSYTSSPVSTAITSSNTPANAICILEIWFDGTTAYSRVT